MSPQLKDLKIELGALRVAKVTGGAPNKLSKMYGVVCFACRVLASYRCPHSHSVRKSIARVLTVVHQNQRAALKEAYKNKVWLMGHIYVMPRIHHCPFCRSMCHLICGQRRRVPSAAVLPSTRRRQRPNDSRRRSVRFPSASLPSVNRSPL